MINKKIYIHSRFSLLIFTLSLLGCKADYVYEPSGSELPEDSQILFSASVLESREEIQTRDLTQEPVPVNIDDYSNNFYIDMNAEIEGEEKTALGTYVVPSGFAGQLVFKGDSGQTKLNWWDVDSPHYFWSWTVPWAEPSTADSDNGKDNGEDNGENNEGGDENTGETSAEENTPFDPMHPTTEPLTFTLVDTTLETYTVPEHEDENGETIPTYSYRDLSEWQNGAILEKFIGAKSGPFNFRENGRDVPLQFRHLLSRIIIESIEFLGADGSTHNDFPAEITFVNMPTTFTFYPHPDTDGTPGEDDRYMQKDGAPVVVTDYDSADPDGGLKFTALNRSEDYPRDAFYICPELDFTDIEFFVDLKDPDNKYNTRGTYWGNFKNVTFDRMGIDGNPLPDYNDQGGGDERVLHAGEEMHFNLVVQQYGGGGTSQWIRDWGNGQPSNAGHHVHPGLYSRGEAAEFLNKSGSQAEIFDLYGEGYTQDLWPDCPEYQENRGIFRLYGDVGVFERMTFPVDNGFILDGMGYTITLRRTGTGSTITLGMMRDVYIQMEDGILMYVDKDGVVFVMDDEGVYIATPYTLDQTSNTINIDDLAKLV